ncbi:MAG: EthD domain-containing protein [Acidimicrobiia bacterium]|nr:EthD domain-containing protein [Acidimicrobiia bacterium]MCY4435525.1 hypothetical protein [bacterium]
MNKAQLLLCAAPDPELAGQLTRFLETWLAGAPDGERSGRVLVRLPDDPMRGHVTDGRPTYEAIVEIGPMSSPNTLVESLRGASSALGDLVEIGASAVIAGTVATIKPGTGDLQLSFIMSRRPDMTAAEFHRYWRYEHVRHAHTDGMVGYHQFHGDPILSAELAAASGFDRCDVDGIAECYLEHVVGFTTNPPTDRGDRVNFADEATEVGVILRTVCANP